MEEAEKNALIARVKVVEDWKAEQIELAKEAKNASKKTSEYRNTAQQSLKKIEDILISSRDILNESNVVLELINQRNEHTKDVLDTINQQKKEAKEAIDLLTSNSFTALEIATKIETFYNKHPELGTELKGLTKELEESNIHHQQITALFNSASDTTGNINNLFGEIFGHNIDAEDLDDAINGPNVHIPGLKDKLERSYDETMNKILKLKDAAELGIADYKNATNSNLEFWEEHYNVLKQKILDLLPGATTSGLAFAHHKKRKLEQRSSDRHAKNFTIGIVGLLIVSSIPVLASITALIFTKASFSEIINRIPLYAPIVIPLYIPFMWVAYSANKKLNLSKRLIEEYSHKEALNTTFEGLSAQINNLENDDLSKALKEKLLFNIIVASAENPGKLITDYNKADHPLMDALEKAGDLSSAVDKLQDIPGFGKLVTILEKRAKKVAEQAQAETDKGMDDIDNIENKEE